MTEMSESAYRVRRIFDREIQRAEDDCETTAFVEWLTRLKAEVIDNI
jgi:hypothetical protein